MLLQELFLLQCQCYNPSAQLHHPITYTLESSSLKTLPAMVKDGFWHYTEAANKFGITFYHTHSHRHAQVLETTTQQRYRLNESPVKGVYNFS
jgi:hypothetical protein